MIEVRPIATALGAEIHGVDLSQPLDGETVAAIRRALLDHLVIFFRDQELTPDGHKAFTARFGPLQIDEFVAGMAGHPEIMEVVKEAGDEKNFAGVWHADVTFQEAPALGAVLYALEVPAVGGDTMFASMYLAYEALSDGMKALLDGLTAVHCAYPAYHPGYMGEANARNDGMRYTANDPRDYTAEHPVVRSHPETGRKGLFVNGSYTVRFSDMSVEESRPLLDYLYAHMTRPEFTCRFSWTPGAVAFWDNRCTHHCPINDYSGVRRAMHRVTIAGDVPA
jgi:taurine dioxygenase